MMTTSAIAAVAGRAVEESFGVVDQARGNAAACAEERPRRPRPRGRRRAGARAPRRRRPRHQPRRGDGDGAVPRHVRGGTAHRARRQGGRRPRGQRTESRVIDLPTVRLLAAAALENVERHRGRVNALNVYPVPDGDTGTNLQKTMEGIVAELDRSDAVPTAQLAADVQRAATMEAKGNSGVIRTTIVRGMARVLGEGDQVDGDVMAQAFRAGATSAYQAVEVPVEGTMLTVI